MSNNLRGALAVLVLWAWVIGIGTAIWYEILLLFVVLVTLPFVFIASVAVFVEMSNENGGLW